MVDLGSASEDEAVLAFLKAEVDSPRFSHMVHHFLGQSGNTPDLIYQADVTNSAQNCIRRAILGNYRGFGANRFLFVNFPNDVAWRHVILDRTDLEKLLYIDESPVAEKDRLWAQLSNGTRRVSVAAGNVRQSCSGEDPRLTTKEHILAVVTALNRGVTYPDVIAVRSDDGPLVLIEGRRDQQLTR